MAINVEIERNANENALAVLRRFTKRVQGSGVLPRVRSLRYKLRNESFYKRKMRTLEVISHNAEQERLKKLGKIPTNPEPKQRKK